MRAPLIVIRDAEEAEARRTQEASRPPPWRDPEALRGPPHPQFPRWRYAWDEGEIKTRAPLLYGWKAVRDGGVEVAQRWCSAREHGAFAEAADPMLP